MNLPPHLYFAAFSAPLLPLVRQKLVHFSSAMAQVEQAMQIYPQRQLLTIHRQNPISSIANKDSKLLAAQKHRLAEQNRRNRISGQYATLCAILPNLFKTDKKKLKKAFVLAETIRTVKKLKKVISEKRGGGGEVGEWDIGFPSGADRLSIEGCDGSKGMVKAVLSCEDREEMVAELERALKTMKVKAVRVEMVTVGGRSKFAVWLKGLKEGSGVLKRALEAVMKKKKRPSWIANNYKSK